MSENTLTLEQQAAALNKRGYTTEQAAIYTGFSISKLRQLRMESSEEKGPAFVKRGRKVIYLREALDAWLEGNVA